MLVVPGFFGYSDDGQLQLLGRGGSDLTAVYLANEIGARRCRLVKDVDGVYERDPALAAASPTRRFVTLGYDEAVERAAKLIQPKAVRFLERHGASDEVTVWGRGAGRWPTTEAVMADLLDLIESVPPVEAAEAALLRAEASPS